MNIIITGASKGIGYETAKLLSARHNVIAIARSADKLRKLQQKSNSKKIFTIPFDFEKGDIRTVLLPEIISCLSRRKGPKDRIEVDVLINNAAILVKKPFEQIVQKEFEKVFRVNFFAIIELTQALLPYLHSPLYLSTDIRREAVHSASKKKGVESIPIEVPGNKMERSHVLNIASMGGVQGSAKFPGLAAYSSSKGALITLTECLAEEYKEKKISFNALAFGAVQTEMLSEAFPGFKAPITADQAAKFVAEFAVTGHRYFNGKILQMALSTP